MSRRVVVSAAVWAVSMGALVTLLAGDRRAVSLRIWLAAFAVWFAIATLQRLFVEVPLENTRLRPIVGFRRRRPVAGGHTVRELRSLESIVLRSQDNHRTHDRQLRPRLVALAEHNLPMIHGVDPRDTKAVSQLLGPVGHVIDAHEPEPPAADRSPGAPDADDLNAFLDIVLGSSEAFRAASPHTTRADR